MLHIEMPFGEGETRMDPQKCVRCGTYWRHLEKTIEQTVVGGDGAISTIID